MTLAAATTPRIVVLGSANDAFGAQLRTTLEAEGIDTRALRTTAAPTGIAQITVTDDGENSITVVAGAVVAFVAFVAGHYVVRTPGRPMTALDILDVLALAIAHAIIALLTWTLLAIIMERGFIDAVVFGVSTVLLAGSTAAITAYLAFFSASHMDLSLLATMLAVFLVEGVVASMLTASDPHWWKMNLSALGMTDDISALAFNLTLIVAGFIVTTLAC